MVGLVPLAAGCCMLLLQIRLSWWCWTCLELGFADQPTQMFEEDLGNTQQTISQSAAATTPTPPSPPGYAYYNMFWGVYSIQLQFTPIYSHRAITYPKHLAIFQKGQPGQPAQNDPPCGQMKEDSG